MSIKLKSSGGGSISINEPTTATDYNVTLPAASGNAVFDSTLSTIPDLAHFTQSTTYTLPNAGIAQVPFNVVLYAQNITYNPTGSTVGGIEAYHWKHTRTGYYKLDYFVRTVTDVWNMIAVCKNANTALPVGNSQRTGGGVTTGVGFGNAFSCIYRVTDITDRFGLYHWTHASAGTMASHAGGNPTSSFFMTPVSGTAATTGYYNDIIITPL